MATKKYITKQLRELTKRTRPEIMQGVRVFNRSTLISTDMKTNPYRRLKRAYKRGEVKLNLLSRNECKANN